MTDQEILKNAPEGAEYTSNIGYLWNDNGDWFLFVEDPGEDPEWVHMFFHEHDSVKFNIRSLADIKRIVELESTDQFWDANNTENYVNTVEEIFESYFDENTKVGLEIKVHQSVMLPDATYVLTELNEDGSFEVELKQPTNQG